jgi:DNA primase
VWNEEALIASKDIILCEALIDALTFWVAGYRNVTASYGVNGFTADHRAAFERHGTERVYIAYDRDDAGDKAAAKLAEELMEWASSASVCSSRRAWTRTNTRSNAARGEGAGGVADRRGVDGQRPTASGPRAVPVIVAEPVAAPAAAAAPTIEPLPAEAKSTAKEKIIEEQTPEPVIEAAAQPGKHRPQLSR